MLSVYLYHKMRDYFKVHHERVCQQSPALTFSGSGILLCCDMANRCFTACSVENACLTLQATELKQERRVQVQGNVQCKLLSTCSWQQYLSDPAGLQEKLVVLIDGVNRLYLCASVCGTRTVSHISSACLHVPFLLLCFGSETSLIPDVITSPSQVCIFLVNLSVDVKTQADMSCRHFTLCTLRHCTKAIEEIYLLRERGTTLLF